MKKLITLSLLFLSPAAAFGADLPGKAPFVNPQLSASTGAADWSGFYAGVNVGAGFGDMNVSLAGFQAIPNLAINDTKLARSGALGGVQAGYGVQSGNLVYGVEADIDLGALRGTLGTTGVFTTTDPLSGLTGQTSLNAKVESRINALSTLRARVGYAFDNVLIYGTGGYATAHHDGKGSLSASDAPVAGAGLTAAAGTSLGSASIHEWVHGWTLGAGAEYAFTRNVGLKVEYLHAQFNNKIAGQSVSHSLNLVRTGVNYRF